MGIYLGVLFVALAPLLLGVSALKRRLDAADQHARAVLSEGSFIASGASGHRTMQQITDAHVDLVAYLMVVAVAFLYPVAVLKLEVFLTGVQGNVLIPVLFGAVVLLWSGYRLRQTIRTVGALRTGLVAELEVGYYVNQLMHLGYYVLHDVPGDGFHIDHIAVGHNGVFVIATNGQHQPRGSGAGRNVLFDEGWLVYPDGEDINPIIQVRGQVAWLGTWLARSLGRPCHPTPVLCLPGWHVELKTTPTFPILNQKYLGWTIPGWQGETLNEDEIQRVYSLLTGRCAPAEDLEDISAAA